MKVSDCSEFEVFLFSDTRHEQMTAHIEYQGTIISQLTMDGGTDAMQFVLQSNFVGIEEDVSFNLDKFLHAIEIARKELAKYWSDT